MEKGIKKRQSSSLALRLAIWFLLLFFLPLAMMGIFIRRNVEEGFGELFIRNQGSQAQILALSVSALDEEETIQLFLMESNIENPLSFLIDKKGTYIVHPDETMVNKSAFDDFPENIVKEILHSESGVLVDEETRNVIGYSAVPTQETIVITVSDAEAISTLILGVEKTSLLQLTFSLVLISIISGLVIWIVVGRPVRHLTKAAEQIAAGNLDITVNPDEMEDELLILTDTFNHMTTQLRELVSGLEKEIIERKQAEEALKNAQNYIINIIDSMPSALIGIDTEGKITQWNSEAERVSGLPPSKALGQPLEEAFPRLASELERVRIALKTREVQKDPKRAYQQNDEIHYEDVTIYPLIANGVNGAVIRVDDITEKVHIEELMIQSEKMLSVGGMAAGMAHEINNPLAGMMQTAGVMRNRLTNLEIPANQRAAEAEGTSIEVIAAFMEARGIPRMLKSINTSGMRVAEIVDNMLSFARRSTSAKTTVNLADLLDKTLELATTDYDLKKQYDFKTIGIVREYEDFLPYVPCESSKIQQVFLNILRNGAQAMYNAQKKEKSAASRFILRIAHEKDEGMLRIEIEDNGAGMDEATRKRIFEPFFTTKPVGEGTGLGLSVSYFIISENHGGTLDVISEPNQGATFIIRLPVEKSES